MKKSIVVYYSRTGENYVDGKIVELEVGNTEVLAKKIQKYTNSEICRLEPSIPYPHSYQETTEKCKKEYHEQARPDISNEINIEKYQTIYLGYPNWWGTMPMIVWTFLQKYDFSDKKIIPFCSHEGSGMGDSEGDIKRLCPNSIVEKGLAIRGSMVVDSDDRIKKWLTNLKDESEVK